MQRHTGEDIEDTTGLVGSGSCVTLPLNIGTPSPPSVKNETPSVKSIHAVGSMAVNSINKSKPFHCKSANRKPAKEASANGHPGDKNGDDSSSSDPERNDRKSPPKRKAPKVTRKKGGSGANASLAKKVPEDKKRKSEKQVRLVESGKSKNTFKYVHDNVNKKA